MGRGLGEEDGKLMMKIVLLQLRFYRHFPLFDGMGSKVFETVSPLKKIFHSHFGTLRFADVTDIIASSGIRA